MQVKVWNDNQYPFKQELRGVKYAIPARQYVEMDEEEANLLLKAYSPVVLGHDDLPLPQTYKMLRIDEEDLKRNRQKEAIKGKSGSFLCQACGYIAGSKWELNGHVMELHRDDWEDANEARQEIAKEEPKKRGRPRVQKEVSATG